MKQRIFNKGRGWYISASNYKNKDDKAYMNVHFAVCDEPAYIPSGDNEFVFIDIDILEQKYEAYQGKINLTVFKYSIIEPKKDGLTEVEKQNHEFAESIQETAYTQKFGSTVTENLDLSPDDLPFY